MTGSTFAKVEIPPVAPTDVENLHVYEPGSIVVITLYERSWLNDAPPTLLSRRTTVQPGGAEMLPLGESRAVTTASMRSPAMPVGRAIEIDVEFETRSVVLPSWKIPSPDGLDGALRFTSRRAERSQAFLKSALLTFCPSRSGFAEAAFAPAINAAPRRTMHAPAVIDRGRLPNMPAESANPTQRITRLTRRRYLFRVLRLEGAPSTAQESLSSLSGYALR